MYYGRRLFNYFGFFFLNERKFLFERVIMWNNLLWTPGFIPEEYFRECMMTMGDRWSEEMVDDLLHGAPIKEGRFDYIEFTRTLKHGAREKDDEDGNAEQQTSPGQGEGQGGDEEA